MMSTKYGPPLPQNAYGPPTDFQPLYGAMIPFSIPKLIFSYLTAPMVVIVSFIVGIVLYLITHKKVFIIVPLILSILYIISRIIETIFGISLSYL